MHPKLLVMSVVSCVLLAACGSGTTESGEDDGTQSTDASAICDQDALDCTGGDAVAAAPQGAAPEESSEYTVQDYLVYMINDIDVMWSEWFVANGFSEPMIGYEIVNPGETYTTTCTLGGEAAPPVTDTFPNAFYCNQDTIVGGDGVTYQGVMVLPETTFQKMWEGEVLGNISPSAGDFAAAIITAHEFGHHIADEMLIQIRTMNPGVEYSGPTGKYKELLADCFAGVWMNSAYYANMLIDTDYQEAVDALNVLGDKGVSADPHGTPEERTAAITAGYNTGQPLSCVDTYWQ